MPQLDYAFLCDYVRPEISGVAHVIGAGIDTVYPSQVPTGHNLGFLARFTFTQGESDRPHRIELFFRNTDGQEFAKIEAVVVPEWNPDLPPGWMVSAQLGLNFGVPLPDYGLYAFELMMDDGSMKSMNLRVVPPPAEQGDAET
jgi:hypothetical protein